MHRFFERFWVLFAAAATVAILLSAGTSYGLEAIDQHNDDAATWGPPDQNGWFLLSNHPGQTFRPSFSVLTAVEVNLLPSGNYPGNSENVTLEIIEMVDPNTGGPTIWSGQVVVPPYFDSLVDGYLRFDNINVNVIPGNLYMIHLHAIDPNPGFQEVFGWRYTSSSPGLDPEATDYSGRSA